jgi:hypothetical protein
MVINEHPRIVLILLDNAHQKYSHSTGHECDPMRIFPPNGPGRFLGAIIRTMNEITLGSLLWPFENLNAVLFIFNSISIG